MDKTDKAYHREKTKEFIRRAKSKGWKQWTVLAPPECVVFLQEQRKEWKRKHKELWVNVPRGFELVKKD